MSTFFSNLPEQENAAVTLELDREPSREDDLSGKTPGHHLLSLPGVEGFAPGPDQLTVYVTNDRVIERLPESIEGVPVRAVATGRIEALS